MTVDDLIAKWVAADTPDRDELLQAQDLISYLTDRLYNLYEPCQFEPFKDRLNQWIGNLTSEGDQKTLYRLLSEIFFVGVREFESLYRAAYSGPIFRWLIDCNSLKFNDPDFDHKLDAAARATWFCPITDSMKINSFLKVNGLSGHPYRPDWRSLVKFGDIGKIKDFIAREGIARLVLLEDFVGTAKQMEKALVFAANLNDKMPVLGCPLLICPPGAERSLELVQQHSNLSIEPVLALPKALFILPDAQAGEPALFANVRQLLRDVQPRLRVARKDLHGFEGTGATVVLHSNCPDNTIPIIREQTDNWDALFPRIHR